MRLLPLLIILLASISCSGEATVEPDSTTNNTNGLYISAHLFETPDGTAVAGEWGRLQVPEARTEPDTNLIEIPFVRFKSSVESPGTPTIFLRGGPGEETLTPDLIQEFLPIVPGLPFDFILVEQRGIGQSRPKLDCPGSYSLPLDRPLDFETMLSSAKVHYETCVQFWTDQGMDLSGYNVREMAADIDALRQALGYDQINLLGGSFGSHHGLAVLRYFGEHVDRAVLSAVEGPNHTIKLPSTIQRHLEELDAIAKTDPELVQQVPEFLDLMGEVLDQLEQEPVTEEVINPQTGEKVQITVGKFDLQVVTAQGLGRTSFLRALPGHYYAMSQGDFSWLGEEALALRTELDLNLMSTLVDCSSGATAERQAQIQQEASEALLGNAINGVQFDLCDIPGHSDLGDEFRADLKTEVPVLLISGSLDPRTPITNAEEVLIGLENGQHLILEGVSHDFELGDELLSRLIQAQGQFLMGQPSDTTVITAPFRFDPVDSDGK